MKIRFLLIIFFAPTEVAKILSFGNIGLGLITVNFWKLKFFMPLAHAPIFSESWGLCKIKVMLLDDIIINSKLTD